MFDKEKYTADCQDTEVDPSYNLVNFVELEEIDEDYGPIEIIPYPGSTWSLQTVPALVIGIAVGLVVMAIIWVLVHCCCCRGSGSKSISSA